jgi:hypothetical protein
VPSLGFDAIEQALVVGDLARARRLLGAWRSGAGDAGGDDMAARVAAAERQLGADRASYAFVALGIVLYLLVFALYVP